MTNAADEMRSPEGGSSLLEMCERWVARAKALGATDAEAFAEYVKGTNVSLEQNDI